MKPSFTNIHVHAQLDSYGDTLDVSGAVGPLSATCMGLVMHPLGAVPI